MFGDKKTDKEMKIVAKDVGFAEDSFSLMKQAVGKEEHHLGDFVNTKSKEDLEKLNKSRKIRSELQDTIVQTLNVKLKNQEWCEMKHLCGIAMHVQELISRCSSLGLIKVAEKLAECHKNLFLEYLTLLGFTQNNISFHTSA